MKNLNQYIKESILDNEEDLINDNEAYIRSFINDNYGVSGTLEVIKGPKDNYIVNCHSNVVVTNDQLTELTNGFEWGYVYRFDCSYCESLKSLKGAPKEAVTFICHGCKSLKTLEGAPKKVTNNFICNFCESLKSLKGAPDKVGGAFRCVGCKSLKTLEGAPKKVGGDFSCGSCKSLKSLKGAPKEIGDDFSCAKCKSLKSLEGIPNKIDTLFCNECGTEFTKDEIKKYAKCRFIFNL